MMPNYAFGREFLADAGKRLRRRSTLAVSVTEHQLYLDVDGQSLNTAIAEHRIE